MSKILCAAMAVAVFPNPSPSLRISQKILLQRWEQKEREKQNARPNKEAANVTHSQAHHSLAVNAIPASASVKHVPSLLNACLKEMPAQARLSFENAT